MLFNSDLFKVETKEQMIQSNGREIYKDQKKVISTVWVWKRNKMRSFEVGEFCPDEILELSFEEDDLTGKHVRMQMPKTNLATSQTGVSMATIESSTS